MNSVAVLPEACVEETSQSFPAEFAQHARPLAAEDEAIAFMAPAVLRTRGGGDATAPLLHN